MTSPRRETTVARRDVRVRDVPRRTFVAVFGRGVLMGGMGVMYAGCTFGDAPGDQDHRLRNDQRAYHPGDGDPPRIGGDVVSWDPRGPDNDHIIAGLSSDPRGDNDAGPAGP